MPHGEQRSRVKLITLDPDVVEADAYARSLPGQLEAAQFRTDVIRHRDDPETDDLVSQAAVSLIGAIY